MAPMSSKHSILERLFYAKNNRNYADALIAGAELVGLGVAPWLVWWALSGQIP